MQDPIFKHALYCSLSKQQRAAISTELILRAVEIFQSTGKPLDSTTSLTTWEAILNHLPDNQRSQFYTLLLDAGVKFSDGSDGIVWGTSKGLRYHNTPASQFSQLRQQKGYSETTRKTAQTLSDTLTKTPKEKRSFLAQLELQLTRNETRLAAQTPSRSFQTRNIK
jgi:hypothetical protein